MDTIVRGTAGGGVILASAIRSTVLCERAREIHNLSPTAAAALGRVLSVTSMMGAPLKGEGMSVTLQMKGGGPGGTVLAVSDSGGNVRGYVANPQVDVPRKPNGKLDVGGYIGKEGGLTVIKDMNLKDPYVGTVELRSGEVAEDIAAYFAESEQIPSVVAAGVLVEGGVRVRAAGGYLIQLMPGYTEAMIDALEEAVAAAGPVTAMLDGGMGPEAILEALLSPFDFHRSETIPVEYRCYCDRERVERVLLSAGKDELQAMIAEQGGAEVTCQFCDAVYTFSEPELTALLASVSGDGEEA
ncbi:Hsp33 family molecular chaperone HslO [Oscillospiraceae bacterium OttesenSCG-928-F05]|nr:Hsp33 family molecular chaperone HslO [Oscillospiraceae bacterium OttesenSCG-928-F05]